MKFTPRVSVAVALLALVPAVAWFGRTWWAAAVTAINVLVITAALYLLFSPTDGHDGHEGHDGDSARAPGDGGDPEHGVA
jgi:fatty acid desaturase